MSAEDNVQVAHHGLTHVHAQVVLVPAVGQNRGVGMRILTCDSLEYGNGAKHVYIRGTQLAPVTIGPGQAEPSWKMTIAKHEWHQVHAHIGKGYLQVPFRLNLSWRLPGKPAHRDSCVFCMIEEDGS